MGSPSFQATSACIASWTVVENRNDTNQTSQTNQEPDTLRPHRRPALQHKTVREVAAEVVVEATVPIATRMTAMEDWLADYTKKMEAEVSAQASAIRFQAGEIAVLQAVVSRLRWWARAWAWVRLKLHTHTWTKVKV